MAKAPTVSIYIRHKGQNFQAAPAVPDANAIYYLRYYDGPKQRWLKVGSYQFLKRAQLGLERQLSAKSQHFAPENDRLRQSSATLISLYSGEEKTGHRP